MRSTSFNSISSHRLYGKFLRWLTPIAIWTYCALWRHEALYVSDYRLGGTSFQLTRHVGNMNSIPVFHERNPINGEKGGEIHTLRPQLGILPSLQYVHLKTKLKYLTFWTLSLSLILHVSLSLLTDTVWGECSNSLNPTSLLFYNFCGYYFNGCIFMLKP
jgi:hypothetical protein